jgi:hypothetical protein
MNNQVLFVDFMYAVTVGATLPRLDDKTLHWCDPLLWALAFLIAVFLEDFYLYHVKVAPLLTGFPSWRGFLLAMLIIATWYLAQAAFPTNQRLFLICFTLFFILKLGGGVLMKAKTYPAIQDVMFLLPACTAVFLMVLSRSLALDTHPGRSIQLLAPIWLLSVFVWWLMDDPESVSNNAGLDSQPKR